MLIFILAMHSFITLVHITIILIQCQAITVRDDDYDVTPKTYTYSDSELARSELEYRQEDYYKPLRHADARAYQYTPEENNQDVDYSQQQSDQETENYPFNQRRDRQQISRRGTPAKKQHVEQYLKEVPPTTKTTYNQRSRNYLRPNSQPHDRDKKEQPEEMQRGILKRPSIQYIVQSDLQQKSGTHPQIQYVISEQKTAQVRPTDQQPHSATLTTYQNALLAHQKVLETESQDETSRSSIFVSHSIPKKPVRKIVKPATREDTEQYAQLQQYEIQQKQPIVYERQQPAEVLYQAKLEYSNRDTDLTVSTQQREKELKQLRQRLEDISQYQQISTEEPLRHEEKFIYPQQLARYQQILSTSQEKTSRPNTLNLQSQVPFETSYQSAEGLLDYKTPQRAEELESRQFQQPTYLKKGPKYLPEPKIVDETEEKYQQVLNIPGQQPEALISFEAAVAKLQSEKLLKARQQRLRRPITYQQEQGTGTVPYTLLTGESRDTAVPETGYIRIGDTSKYRSIENVSPVSYNQNTNIRYYRNPGRQTISYSQQQ